MLEPIISVITPTIGRESLRRAIESVRTNASENCTVEHLLIVDGPEREQDVLTWIDPSRDYGHHYRIKICVIPYKTARSGAICRAVGATVARGQFVAFLDDDNYYLPQHLSRCHHILTEHPKLDWLHTGRFIIGEDLAEGELEDLSQSLGLLHQDWALPLHHMVDTNCYFLRKKVCLASAAHWHLNAILDDFGEDRVLFSWLVNRFPRHGFLFEPTVCYLADPGVVSYIREGNQKVGARVKRQRGRLIVKRNPIYGLKLRLSLTILRYLMKRSERKRDQEKPVGE